ncbi:hypothetical protein EJ03DRAFT_35294 [Teratosphaeria nubilosa]|uniref:Uncharacterized protein n=1 Tax=Teratosphaeria nubilosa TaxID=161662 RepID=A0A6G1KU90_9PEZI|nr:hypothetical protein EJ03DRAFT_35294 [Teratosphaeria nubilosa]
MVRVVMMRELEGCGGCRWILCVWRSRRETVELKWMVSIHTLRPPLVVHVWSLAKILCICVVLRTHRNKHIQRGQTRSLAWPCRFDAFGTSSTSHNSRAHMPLPVRSAPGLGQGYPAVMMTDVAWIRNARHRRHSSRAGQTTTHGEGCGYVEAADGQCGSVALSSATPWRRARLPRGLSGVARSG